MTCYQVVAEISVMILLRSASLKAVFTVKVTSENRNFPKESVSVLKSPFSKFSNAFNQLKKSLIFDHFTK